ncbi:unnamed protein product [Pieris macdunnoughi]|uniref:Uncharacterized protein n=1 Tax=Pieris macdunnoughi TaxID=345717 RepID=A0A821W8Q2_9NEOP|nr:unnamed protein product [Pieris macdunnoughi]
MVSTSKYRSKHSSELSKYFETNTQNGTPIENRLKKMEEMKQSFNEQNEELAEQFTKSILNTIDEKLSPLIAETQRLKEVKIFQLRVQNLEREARKNNVYHMALRKRKIAQLNSGKTQ